MKYCALLFFCVAAGLSAQSAASTPAVKSDTVVATVDGKKMTAGELEKFVGALPPQMQQNFQANRKEFLRQYALLKRLSDMAEQKGLPQQSPYKERLESTRMQMLAQAQINDASDGVTVTPEEQKAYFEKNKDRFTQANVKVIYIPFSANAGAPSGADGKKTRTEAEAQARAEEVAKKARGGGDFKALVKEYSEDPTSAEKEGDFGTIKRTDSIPEEIKTAIFAAKPGEIAGPLKQPNGFYVFRVEGISEQPYSTVENEIQTALRQDKFREWLEGVRKSINVQFDNEAYFSPQAAAPAPAQ